MFISFSISDASLVWRRFLHSLGQVSSPGETDSLHTNRDRSSLSYWVYHYKILNKVRLKFKCENKVKIRCNFREMTHDANIKCRLNIFFRKLFTKDFRKQLIRVKKNGDKNKQWRGCKNKQFQKRPNPQKWKKAK